MFDDRADAGRQLAEALAAHAGDANAIVFGIPRGGVIVAAEVARGLGLPLDVAVAAKIGAPGNAEYAVGAVAADGVVVGGPQSGFSAEALRPLAEPAQAKVALQLQRFRRGRMPLDVVGRTAILVDDGLATGLTAMAAADWLRRQGAGRVIVAVPVAPPDTVASMRAHADEVVALEEPAWFSAVGQFYRRFGQTEDSEVARALGVLGSDSDAEEVPDH